MAVLIMGVQVVSSNRVKISVHNDDHSNVDDNNDVCHKRRTMNFLAITIRIGIHFFRVLWHQAGCVSIEK